MTEASLLGQTLAWGSVVVLIVVLLLAVFDKEHWRGPE